MACKEINLTKEEVTNILANRGTLFELTPEDTVDDILNRYKYLQDVMELPTGDNARYSIFNNVIQERFSNIAKRKYESRIGTTSLEKTLQQPDFIKKKDAGSRIHEVLANIMLAKLGKKRIAEVRGEAGRGNYAIKSDDFDELVNLVDEIYDDIQKQQFEIEPKGKVTILVEQRILDPVKNMGGTMDIHAVFSDGTGLIYDYKTTHSKAENFQFNELVDDLLHENKIADNELTMAEYKRVAIQRMGIKKVRQTRLIPIHVRLGLKPESQWSDFNYRTTEIELIEAGSRTGRSSDRFLKPIPVAGEGTKYAGINELLDRQYNLLKILTSKLENTKLSIEDRDRLRNKVSALRRTIRKTITEGEIFDIIDSANAIVSEINERVHIPKENGKGIPNPLYLTDSELIELVQEIKIYTDIIENTSYYYRDLQEESPEDFKILREEISVIASNVQMALTDAKQELNKRTLESVVDDAKDNDGNLKPMTELDYLTRNFTRISEIDHPIFRSAWELIQNKLFEQRQILKKMSEDIDEKDKAVAVWAKANGMSKLDALKKIINFETSHLINKISKEFYDKIESAYTNPDPEKSYKQLTSLLKLKDEAEFKKRFEERFKNYKERMKYKHMDDPKKEKEAVDLWYLNNNLLDSEIAWTNKYNRKYLIIKPELEEINLSEEYKAIRNSKPLLDYYDMYRKYNDQFRDILGISHYNKLPSNFIPNIRKSMTESIVVDDIKSAFKYITTEFWDSFNVRDEDVYISDIDSSGNLRRTVPILYLNPLRNKDNRIDNTKKSYDLSKNLLIFAKMAYNYQAMNEIEPTIIGMKELMGYPTSDQGGTQVLDSYGRKVIGNIREYALKKGYDTDTYKLFEDLTDFYLYGIKFKSENSLGNSARLTKAILKLKNYYAKKALSFAMIPGIGAYLAGNAAGFFEGVKGINYTKENIVGAGKNKIKDFIKFKALSLFFDVYAEDPLNALADSKSANFLTKIGTTRNMFYPLRKTDELINDEVANRLALNWGIDTENKTGLGKNALVRLNRPDIDTTGIKSIWELTTVDKKTGKVTIEGIIDKDGNIVNKDAYIGFRNAVKSTSASIIGSLSQEDISRIDTHLVYNLMFQFKSWMPGIIKERFGGIHYDDKTQAVRWGRYKAAFAEYGLSSSEMDGAQKINNFFGQIVLPNMGRTVLDLITFGLAFKTGLGGVSHEYTNKQGRIVKVRSNTARAKRMYYDWVMKNNLDPNKVTFELYLETKEAQMRAMITELRAIMSFMTVLLFLGADGNDEDGKPRYMENYLTRLVYKSMAKANSELTFLWSPAQMAQIIKNPIPMASVFTDILKLTKNTFDEGRDIIFGENSPYDKSPAFFYTLQMAYGGNQLARFLELYQQYEKNPYLLFQTGR